MTTNDIPKLRCHDGCGAEVDDDDTAALAAGWSFLQATRAWRCPKCWRELLTASSMAGKPNESVDTLPPDSLGALKKETASTILPPTVRPLE